MNWGVGTLWAAFKTATASASRPALSRWTTARCGPARPPRGDSGIAPHDLTAVRVRILLNAISRGHELACFEVLHPLPHCGIRTGFCSARKRIVSAGGGTTRERAHSEHSAAGPGGHGRTPCRTWLNWRTRNARTLSAARSDVNDPLTRTAADVSCVSSSALETYNDGPRRPPSSRRMRSHDAASAGLCVTMIEVSPCSRCMSRTADAGRRPWLRRDCRSARRQAAAPAGTTSARATATRCCSPPDSAPGRCAARAISPTRASSVTSRVGGARRPAARR